MAGAATVDEYLAGLPDEQRGALETIRATVRAAVPEVTETISYQIPTFKLRGRGLIAYAAFKSHCSLFPMSKAVVATIGEEAEQFQTGKGTLQFTLERQIPAALVTRIVQARVAELEAARA